MINKTFLSTCALAAMLAATPALAQQATEQPLQQQPGQAGQAEQQVETMPPAPETTGGQQQMQAQDPAVQPGQDTQMQAQEPVVQQPQQQMAMDSQLELQGGFVIRQMAGQVLGSNLMDAEVVTIADESLGSVNDVLLDDQGRVAAIIVGVGGFLGIGQKDVGIPLESAQVLFRGAEQAGQDWWGGSGQIERIVVDFTRDQLEDAPEFARLEDGDTMATGATGTGTGATGTGTTGTTQPGTAPGAAPAQQ